MKLQVPIKEAISLIKTKTGKNVSLKVIDSKTVNVGYEFMIKVPFFGEISKKINLDLFVEKVESDTLYMQYSAGVAGIDMILNGIIGSVPAFSSQEIVQKLEDNRIAVHLREINEIREAINQININELNFVNDSAIVDFTVKV